MANFYTSSGFNYASIDLNLLVANQTEFEFLDDEFLDLEDSVGQDLFPGDVVYEDLLLVQYSDTGSLYDVVFGGSGFTMSPGGDVTGGTVTGIVEINDATEEGWFLQGINYSAVAIAAAVETADRSDDFRVVSEMLRGNDTFYLSEQADQIRGYAGSDLIYGYGGNDTLWGDAGSDTLNGGGGADSMIGGSGNDVYIVGGPGDRVYETSTLQSTVDAGGTDLVKSGVGIDLSAYQGVSFVEKLTLTGTGSIDGMGNALANTIIGNSGDNVLSGRGGNDVLDGGAGNDTLRGGIGNDRLDGGNGADSMAGGVGNDTYVVGNRSDIVTEFGGEGTDTIRSSANRVLDANVEQLVLTGSANINGTGNDLPNRITGNAGANVLSGGGKNDALSGENGNDTLSGGPGADRLAGGAGNDSLSGGLGGDIFRFDAPLSRSSNLDRITDFSVVADTIHLENSVFKSLTATGTLASGLLRVGAGVTGGADGNDYLIYNSTSGALYYDADGSGSASAPIQFATLGNGLSLTSTDFFVT